MPSGARVRTHLARVRVRVGPTLTLALTLARTPSGARVRTHLLRVSVG